jgi:hypothetical protein
VSRQSQRGSFIGTRTAEDKVIVTVNQNADHRVSRFRRMLANE